MSLFSCSQTVILFLPTWPQVPENDNDMVYQSHPLIGFLSSLIDSRDFVSPAWLCWLFLLLTPPFLLASSQSSGAENVWMWGLVANKNRDRPEN